MATASEEFYERATGRSGEVAENEDTAAGLFAIAFAICELSHAVHRLGNADALTPMGGLEALGKVIEEAAGTIAMALQKD